MIGRTGDVAQDLSRLHFSGFGNTGEWTPEVNIYRYDDRFELWADLAGVEKHAISVDVLPDRIRISGSRKPPLPTRDASSQCRQVMAMEIENGRFSREIVLPMEVDRDRVSARLENGLLWVVLPFAKA